MRARRAARAEASGARGVAASRAFHGGLLAVGTAFLLVNAFHGNIWFDESYSVAIANHSFSDIWYIGSGDVHPVLFYWALHVLNLVFGQNILVYRLFTIAGAAVLALLGYTHVRRDFGWRAGVLFSFLALFTPYIAVIAVEIRMYTWAAVAIMLCALYAWRIAAALRAGDAAARGEEPTGLCGNVAARVPGLSLWAGVPRRWWLAFFAASLAGAYLHYFGVLAAFMVNALLLAFLAQRAVRLRRAWRGAGAAAGTGLAAAGGARDGAATGAAAALPRGGRALCVYAAGAVLVVAAFAPWLRELFAQLGVVSGTYWANIVFPTTYIEWATYPVLTSFVSFAARGSYGTGWQTALCVIGMLAVVWLAALAAWGAVRTVRRRSARRGGAVGAAASAGAAAPAASAAPAGGTASASASASTPASVPSSVPAPAARLPWTARVRRRLASDAAAPVWAGLAVYLGVLAIGWAASVAMGSLILYYRYLVVAIGPLMLACALLLARVRSRALVGGACALLLAVAVVNQSLLVIDDYDPRNEVPIDALEDAVAQVSAAQGGGEVLVVSTDIGYMGVTAVMCPDIPQTYMDWQPGNWGRGYLAYAPTMESEKSWELILDDFHGTFIVLGQSQAGTWPRDVSDLSKKDGYTVVESHTYFRPYERTWLTIAVMEKE